MSVRIEILGQDSGFYNNSGETDGVVIDRIFPGLLNSKMCKEDWKFFCDSVDKTLEPVGPLKKKFIGEIKRFGRGTIIAMFIVIGISIAMFIVMATIFSLIFKSRPTSGASSFSITNSREFEKDPPFFLIPVFFVGILIPSVIVVSRKMFQQVKKASEEIKIVMDNLQRVCDTESSKNADISFHVRSQTNITGSSSNGSVHTTTIYYIECSVGGVGGGGVTLLPISAIAEPISEMDDKGSGRTAAQRLQELENIKAMISEEEYNTKRQTILNGI